MSVKISMVQLDIRWESVDYNLSKIEMMLERAVRPDLILLPETFATGFAPDPHAAAEQYGSEAGVEFMRRTARRFGCAVSGTLVVEDRGRCFNRHMFVTPTFEAHYDKRHLFSIGGEGKTYTAGNERRIVEWRGVRWLLSTCYDLRFPVWLRNRGDYDAMICAACWPTSRALVWRTLLQARAIENSAYVIGVNRVGADPSAEYSGESMVVDYRGQIICNAGTEECVAEAEINMESLGEFRRKFPVGRDADRFRILDLDGEDAI